jgi:uncharacterized protein (DUF58 family)
MFARLRKRIHDWGEEHVKERVTKTGLLFLCAVVFTGLGAFASANNLIFLLLAVMLSTVLISNFVSRLGLAGLELDLLLPEHITARQPTPARLRLRNEKKWFPSFSIRVTGVEGSVVAQSVYFPVLPGGAVLEEPVSVRFAQRGVHTGDSFRFSSRFPFGFAERRMKVSMSHEVLVYPSLAPQPGFEDLAAAIVGDADARFRGRGHDFYRIRPYEPPESARHVDWRKTAQTGELMVREFARERDPQVSIFLDLGCSLEQGPWFEHAVDCCAYLSWHTLRRGCRLLFHTQDYRAIVPGETDVYGILKYLAMVRPRPEAAPLSSVEEDSVVIIFTSGAGRAVLPGWDTARVLHPGSLPLPAAIPPA